MAIFHVIESHHGLVAWISWWSHTPTELGFDDRGKERGCVICDFCCLHFIVQMSEKGPSRYQFQRQCKYYICFLQKRSFTGNHWLTWIWNVFRRRAVHDISNSLHILFHLCIYIYLYLHIYMDPSCSWKTPSFRGLEFPNTGILDSQIMKEATHPTCTLTSLCWVRFVWVSSPTAWSSPLPWSVSNRGRCGSSRCLGSLALLCLCYVPSVV